ncbi:50S ribosomal protein L6 [Candidatus Gracilibacteria bacterium GN02-872]|nr:50S ribosomal protein L6 [Candidatus Gracilibacteria bacterium GN02-872]RKW21152.1 MAG: 50S ribosomal protein L6 [Candidatus Gracilibacteria bacterium]
MSRIGKLPIEISDKVEVTISGNNIKVKGPLGELSYTFSSEVEVKKEDNTIVSKPLNEEAKALWGTTRAIINNMVIGVTEGYKKALEINGVGYKFEVSGNKLILSIGLSHKVEMLIPAGLKAELDGKAKNVLHISGIDKQLVGEFASKVRAKKKPEPYKGKGIRYTDEYVRRKAGKTGGK